MGRLQKVIKQLKEEEFQGLLTGLTESKADKFSRLLQLIRAEEHSLDEVQKSLDVNSSAFYTLKSRLYDRIQEYLLENMEGPKIDLLRKIANIPNLIYNTPKATAIAILSKLEKDLKDFDMPHELTAVYSAFKKLHLHSPKYYDYASLHNKHVAYTLGHDKAEDLLADFNKHLGEYMISKNVEIIEVLSLLKLEMGNLTKLYESHHMYIYQGIINVSYALFLPKSEATASDEPIEDILSNCADFISAYPKDANYQYLNKVINFLSFEYYHKLELHKKETEYFEIVNDVVSSFLLGNFASYNSKFLLSKVERYVMLGEEASLSTECEVLENRYYANVLDVPNYVNYKMYMAASYYYVENYSKAIGYLNELLNEISFKPYGHSEVEVKLFLALNYSLVNKYDVAWGLIRSASRKVRELNKLRDYENANYIIKLLKAQLGSNRNGIEEKMTRLKDKFVLMNQGEVKMLSFLRFDDKLISVLARPIK